MGIFELRGSEGGGKVGVWAGGRKGGYVSVRKGRRESEKARQQQGMWRGERGDLRGRESK